MLQMIQLILNEFFIFMYAEISHSCSPMLLPHLYNSKTFVIIILCISDRVCVNYSTLNHHHSRSKLLRHSVSFIILFPNFHHNIRHLAPVMRKLL